MRDNDIMSETFNQEIPDPKKPQEEAPWAIQLAGAILVACILSVVVCVTLRFDRWLLG